MYKSGHLPTNVLNTRKGVMSPRLIINKEPHENTIKVLMKKGRSIAIEDLTLHHKVVHTARLPVPT